MTLSCLPVVTLRIVIAVAVASAVSACVMSAGSDPSSLGEEPAPSASIKPHCPSGCGPQAAATIAVPLAPRAHLVAATVATAPGVEIPAVAP